MEHVRFGLGLVGQGRLVRGGVSLARPVLVLFYFISLLPFLRLWMEWGFYVVAIKIAEAREEKVKNLLDRSIKYPGNLSTSEKLTGSMWNYRPNQ